jgi:hypothetical protein
MRAEHAWPGFVRAKLAALAAAADDARLYLQSPHSEAERLRQMIGQAKMDVALAGATAPASAAEIAAAEARIGELLALADGRRQAYYDAEQLVVRVREWLATLPPQAALVPVPAEPIAGEPTPALLARLRAEIGALAAELHTLRFAPMTRAEIGEAIDKYITAKAAGVMLQPSWKGELLVTWQPERLDGISALCALDPERMRIFLRKRAEDLCTGELPRAKRAARMAELTAAIEDAERREEALVAVLSDAGFRVTRRADASPACVLGVRVADAAAAAALEAAE